MAIIAPGMNVYSEKVRGLCVKGFVFLLWCFSIGYSSAQNQKGPIARFTFNYGSAEDEINHRPIKSVGVSPTVDRFGNENCAVFFYGNSYSYINLGSHSELKPKEGSISLWVKMEHKMWAGTGAYYNPIIITKNTGTDDFYESYAIYYMLESERLATGSALDSTRDFGIYSNTKFERNIWHHLVFCYNFDRARLYIDGALQAETSKKFETKFLPGDSVMLGVTANKKNNRSFNGIIDDVEFYDRFLTPEEVLDLYNAPDPNKKRVLIKRMSVVLGVVLLLLVTYLLIRRYLKASIRKGKEKLELANKLLENELRINRAMMNPHFVFNAMNTLHGHIIKQDYEKASDYLVKFSRLIRKILDSNMSDTLTLETEIEILERYLEIETLRFREHIFTRISVEPPLHPSVVCIPIMMLQPFVENSVWHGLRNKEGHKEIRITFSLYEEKYVKCTIEDNGIGREKSRQPHSARKSLATNFIEQRLELLNKIHGTQAALSIEDKPNGQGTIVTITLPIINR